MSNKTEIVKVFFPDRKIVSINPLGSGRINETWLVDFDGNVPYKAVLQKLNGDVFPEPENVMANLRLLSDHLKRFLAIESAKLTDQWYVVSPYLTPERFDHTVDVSGGFWRMLSYVDGAVSFEHVASKGQAHEVGAALGKFHKLTSGLDPECFFDTLPGFHVTPEYLCRYDSVAEEHGFIFEVAEEKFCAEFVEKYREGANLLEKACENGRVKKRVIHGDPKVSNIMFSEKTGKAVSLIDLDTVKPGLLHYDLGDCFRSSCNPVGGSVEDLDGVKFDTETFAGVLEGYVGEMGSHLTANDYDLIGPAVYLISFELGLRYFTDHLQGDVYFKTDMTGQNLKRAIGQFLLADDIRKKETEIRDVVDSFRSLN